MGLLDGDLREAFGSVFGQFYLDGTLCKVSLIDNGRGDFDQTQKNWPIKIQKERSFRQGSADTGVLPSYTFLILQSGMKAAPYTNDELLYDSQRYSILAVTSDPASTHWVVEAVQING
jgi:hypothetical protein